MKNFMTKNCVRCGRKAHSWCGFVEEIVKGKRVVILAGWCKKCAKWQDRTAFCGKWQKTMGKEAYE